MHAPRERLQPRRAFRPGFVHVIRGQDERHGHQVEQPAVIEGRAGAAQRYRRDQPPGFLVGDRARRTHLR